MPAASVHAGGSLHALNVQRRKNQREEKRPYTVRDTGRENVCLLANPDNADHRIQEIIHHHAPTRNVAQRGVDLLSNVSEGGPCAGIRSGHASIADRGEQHRDHGNENRGDYVAAPAVAEHAKHRHRRDRLDDDNAVKN
jgi:hypothetical protein